MSKLAFVMSGPQGGQIVHLDDDDFDAAIADGWAVDFEAANKGGNPDPFAGWNNEPHEKAEAYLTARGLYRNREMRSDRPDKSPSGDNEDATASPSGDKPKSKPTEEKAKPAPARK